MTDAERTSARHQQHKTAARRTNRLAGFTAKDSASFLAHAHYRDRAAAPVSDRQAAYRLARLRAGGRAGVKGWGMRRGPQSQTILPALSKQHWRQGRRGGTGRPAGVLSARSASATSPFRRLALHRCLARSSWPLSLDCSGHGRAAPTASVVRPTFTGQSGRGWSLRPQLDLARASVLGTCRSALEAR